MNLLKVVGAAVGAVVLGTIFTSGVLRIMPPAAAPDQVHGLAEAGSGPSTESDVQAIIAEEGGLNAKCRGGSGDNTATMKACSDRDKLIEQLRAEGWCWGTPEQAEYQKKWQLCTLRSASAFAGGVSPGAGDPYASGQRNLRNAEYEQEKADLLNRVRIAQHAYRCRVIQAIESQMIFITGVNRLSKNELDAGRSDYHPGLIPELKAAAADADKMASMPGACNYWVKNPASVAEVRREARLATLP